MSVATRKRAGFSEDMFRGYWRVDSEIVSNLFTLIPSGLEVLPAARREGIGQRNWRVREQRPAGQLRGDENATQALT